MVDVIKLQTDDPNLIVWKFPSEDISHFGQLIVNEGWVAIFVKQGQVLDLFRPGRHTLKTGNVPLLEKLVNLPFGGDTPFTAEVWFIKTNRITDLKWGTPSPLSIFDPKYQIAIPARLRGHIDIRITDPKLFFKDFIGTVSVVDKFAVARFIRGKFLDDLEYWVTKLVKEKAISLIDEKGLLLREIEKILKIEVQPIFREIGVEVSNFELEALEYDENDPSVQMIKQSQQEILMAKTKKTTKVLDAEAEKEALEKLGVNYMQKKMIDVGMAAAQNEGAGGVQAGMMGAGMGWGMGQMMAGMFQPQMMQADPNDPAVRLQKLKNLLDQGLITAEEYDSRKKEILANI